MMGAFTRRISKITSGVALGLRRLFVVEVRYLLAVSYHLYFPLC